jgi:hypothetical protein
MYGGRGVEAFQPASMAVCACIEVNPENLVYQLLILIKNRPVSNCDMI